MKITKSKLNQIIKEEVVKLLIEQDEYDYYEEEELTPAQKIINLLTSPDPDNVNQGLTILDALGDQQLIDTIASHFTFDSESSSITTRGFDLPQELGMILNYFAEKSDRVKYMLAQIESLNITDIFITNVDFLRFCTNLTTLDLRYCKSLENVDGLKECTNLTTLDLEGCGSLQNVDGLKECTNLTSLNLRWCSSMQNVDGLEGCTNLTTLTLWGCRSLPPELRRRFRTDGSGTAYNHFMNALNASKGSQP